MPRLALLILCLAIVIDVTVASRWTLSVSGQQADGDKASQQQQQQNVQAQQGPGTGLPPVQPWNPWQQMQQNIQQQLNPQGSQQQQNPQSSQQQQNAPQPGAGLKPVQPWNPWQQMQQDIQQQINPQNSSQGSSQDPNQPTPLKPSMQFVTLSQQQRPAEMQQAEQQLKKQQEQPNNPENFECGKPYMPCGSAIPEGKTCKQGAGWCEPGHFCGYESTTTELSKCLPLPKDCGKAGQPCCPSNTDSPHTSLEDKMGRKPYCKDGSTCFYFAPVPGLNNGDLYAGNKGAYACTAVAPDCGTGPGKPCCPFAYKIDTNPQLKRTGCSEPLFCNYDVSPAAAANISSTDLDHMPASQPGTCEANTADCGQLGKSCCITTAPSSTGMACGARWNETGQRGYCADPFDAGNSAGQQQAAGGGGSGITDVRQALMASVGSSGGSSGSSSGGSGGSSSSSKRKASYRELVCTPCPVRTDNVANNPSKYWPC